LKLENLEYDKEKKFMVNITENNINSYNLDIVEDNEQTQKGIDYSNNLFESKFTEDAIPAYKVMVLYFLSMFI